MFKVTTAYGELKSHQLILNRLKQALGEKDFSLTIVFPTLSLLNAVQEDYLDAPEVYGIGGIKLLLFQGFIQEVCQQLGIIQQTPSAVIRDLLVKEAFQELNSAGRMGYLGKVPFTGGYRRAILAGIAEWKRSCLGPDFFLSWAAGKTDQEKQLALLYQKYQEILTHKGYNEDDLILFKLTEVGKRSGVLPERSVVILYGFTDLTPLQNKFLDIMSTWFDFEIIIDPSPAPELQSYIARHFPVAEYIESSRQQLQSALDKLQAFFGTSEPKPFVIEVEDKSVQLLETAGRTRQAEAIAREIVSLIRPESTFSLDDFLIIAPEPQAFLKAAVPIFNNYRLPLKNEQLSIREFPNVKLFNQALTVSEANWLWPEMEMIIRQHYSGISAAEGDRLILELSRRYGALSGRERWLALVEKKGFRQYLQEQGFNLEPFFRCLELLSRIPEEAGLHDYLKLTQNWFRENLTKINPGAKRCNFYPDQWMGELAAAKIVIETITEIINYLVEAPGLNQIIGIKDFQVFFGEYILPLEVTNPVSSQYGIRIIVPREARGLRAKVVFITGLEQGVFPRNYIHDWKLSLVARRELKEAGIEMETGEQYQVQESMAFYWSLQAAGDRLYLVCQTQDDNGQPLNHSKYLDEIHQYIPEIFSRAKRYQLAPEPPASFSRCYAQVEAKSRLASYLVADDTEVPPEDLLFCRELMKLPLYRKLVLQAWQWRNRQDTPIFKNPDSMKLLHKLFGPDYIFGITALEDFHTCPYRFFFKHILKVNPLAKSELLPDNLELGNLYHQVLHDFCDNHRGEVISRKNNQTERRLLTECFEDYYREWRENAANDLIRLVLTMQEEQVRKTLEQWLNSEYLWAEQSGEQFKIAYLEFGFGLVRGDFDPASLPVPYQIEANGVKFRIWGKVDRIDLDADGNFIVYDYKSGRGPVSKDLLQLKSFQIPVYILALEELQFGTGKATGGSYLGLKEPSRSRGGVWHQEKIGYALTGKSLLSQAEWQAWTEGVKIYLAEIVQAIRNGEFDQTAEECPPFCEYKFCCRLMEREVTAPDEISSESTAS